MTKYLTQSANVLNDADRFEGIMKFNEFANAQEIQLWTGEPGWRPGTPLYPAHNIALSIVRQHIPMIEEVDDNVFHNSDRVRFFLRCEDCLVSWTGDDPCWMCGTEGREEPWFDSLKLATVFTFDGETLGFVDDYVAGDSALTMALYAQENEHGWTPRPFVHTISPNTSGVEFISYSYSPTVEGDFEFDEEAWRRANPPIVEQPAPGCPMSFNEMLFGNSHDSARVTDRQQRSIREMLGDVDLNARPAIEPPVIRRRNDALDAYLARQDAVTVNDLNTPRRRNI